MNATHVCLIVTLAASIFFAPMIGAEEMKPAGWPNVGVVWTAITNYGGKGESYSTNFPVVARAADAVTSPAPAAPAAMPKVFQRQQKFAEKMRARKGAGAARMAISSITPQYPPGKYVNGSANGYQNSYVYATPLGSYMQGDDYYILYLADEQPYYRNDYIDADYDYISAYDHKYIRWQQSSGKWSYTVYLQKINASGTPVSANGWPLCSAGGSGGYRYEYRSHYVNGVPTTLVSTNYSFGTWSGDWATAGLLDCGRNILISGQVYGENFIWVPESPTNGYWDYGNSNYIFYVENGALKTLTWPAWCSGNAVTFASGHLVSGRETKYLHVFDSYYGSGGTRVWRLLPR